MAVIIRKCVGPRRVTPLGPDRPTGIRADSTINPATTPKAVAPSSSPPTVTTQVATTMSKMTTVTEPKSAVPITAAATPAPTTHTTTALPQMSVATTKPSTTAISGSQGATHPVTDKTEKTTVAATSSSTSTHVRTTKNSMPTAASPSVHATQPTNLPKTSTLVLKSSTAEGISKSNVTENATQPGVTSRAFTSEHTISKNVTSYSSTVASTFGVSPSPMTLSKTTAGTISDSTTGSIKEEAPKIPPSVNYTQENIEVSCKKEHRGSLVKINIKSSRICGENANKDEEDAKEILKHICTALKPGYQPNKDKCHIDLGETSDKLVIVNAYVQSSLQPDDLYASLKHIKKDSFNLFQFDESKLEEEDVVSIPLISAIVSLAVALLIIAAIYGCWHQRQTRKREQRLTEELQTMENGYHDNPTLEVMETSPEMQEKKGGPNGELGDSWIVPLDNLTREDFDEEEDTHL
ncbi:podocalyxin isoform X1 [Ranitomeya variabilis]|uniref:podocalyxin isoform X1 n=2 Tax=Ranitomeya variabilis TaxID=490064 RepID=UPI0040566DCB